MGRSSRLDRWVSGRGRAVLIGIAILAMLALPVANVFATHIFSDVSDSSPYAPAIHAIANAGITGGCNQEGTKYCPKGLVTREQMAVFLNRVGNLNNEHGPIVDALTVNGEASFKVPEQFTLSGTPGKTACVTSENTLPAFSELPYAVTVDLYDAPAIASEVNVSVDDPNQEDGEFDVCFTSIAATTLDPGDYKTVQTITLFLGSGIFADAGASAAATQFMRSFRR